MGSSEEWLEYGLTFFFLHEVAAFKTRTCALALELETFTIIVDIAPKFLNKIKKPTLIDSMGGVSLVLFGSRIVSCGACGVSGTLELLPERKKLCQL